MQIYVLDPPRVDFHVIQGNSNQNKTKELMVESWIYIHTNTHCNIICNNQKAEATQKSILTKHDIYTYVKVRVSTHSGILFNRKEERNSDICLSVYEPWVPNT